MDDISVVEESTFIKEEIKEEQFDDEDMDFLDDDDDDDDESSYSRGTSLLQRGTSHKTKKEKSYDEEEERLEILEQQLSSTVKELETKLLRERERADGAEASYEKNRKKLQRAHHKIKELETTAEKLNGRIQKFEEEFGKKKSEVEDLKLEIKELKCKTQHHPQNVENNWQGDMLKMMSDVHGWTKRLMSDTSINEETKNTDYVLKRINQDHSYIKERVGIIQNAPCTMEYEILEDPLCSNRRVNIPKKVEQEVEIGVSRAPKRKVLDEKTGEIVVVDSTSLVEEERGEIHALNAVELEIATENNAKKLIEKLTAVQHRLEPEMQILDMALEYVSESTDDNCLEELHYKSM